MCPSRNPATPGALNVLYPVSTLSLFPCAPIRKSQPTTPHSQPSNSARKSESLPSDSLLKDSLLGTCRGVESSTRGVLGAATVAVLEVADDRFSITEMEERPREDEGPGHATHLLAPGFLTQREEHTYRLGRPAHRRLRS